MILNGVIGTVPSNTLAGIDVAMLHPFHIPERARLRHCRKMKTTWSTKKNKRNIYKNDKVANMTNKKHTQELW